MGRDRETETERQTDRQTEKVSNIVFYAQSTITVISGGRERECGEKRLKRRVREGLRRDSQLISNWTLTSCQPCRITSGADRV